MEKIDPICGMKGSIEAYGHYFCSEYCVKKYEMQFNIDNKECPKCAEKSKKWFRENLFLVIAGLIFLIVADYFLTIFGLKFLNNLVSSFYYYLKMVWIAIIVGLFIGGIIDYFVPREYISKYLSKNDKKTIFYSVGLGFLMSACSHGILAISIALYRKGASAPSVVSFLLASPWANMPVTILLFGFFGVKAFLLVGSAVIIAINSGLIYQILDKKGLIEKNKFVINVEDNFSIKDDVKKRWQNRNFTIATLGEWVKGILKGSWELSKMVLWWILTGIFLAALVKTYVPQDFLMNYMGKTLIGLFVTLILATIIEICSEGTSPLAFEIYRQTRAFGNSFAFLMAGVATDYTEIGLIWNNIGKKSALWLPVITVPQILLLGYLFNFIS